jgi:hypothetical protein
MGNEFILCLPSVYANRKLQAALYLRSGNQH